MIKTPEVQIGNVKIGGLNPVAIQSMTNTQTSNVTATVSQILQLTKAGSEMVRVTVNDMEAAKAVSKIKERLLENGCQVPLIGDFHYNGHILLERFPACALSLDKYRINPGNVGTAQTHRQNFRTMVETAIKYNKPVRIGINWGSLDQTLFAQLMDENAHLKNPKSEKEILYKAMVESALDSAAQAEKIGLPKNKIVLSTKMSDVEDVIRVNQLLASRSRYALHLGLTEAGMGDKGIVASTAALAILLNQKIGDTIRVSITPNPGQPRTKEVEICRLLLQTMGFRQFKPSVTSCPGCGRTNSDLYQRLAEVVTRHIEKRMPLWQKRYPGVEKLKIAVMGCIVNGPGESKNTDIGISLPGRTESHIASVYIEGKKAAILKGKSIPKDFLALLDKYVDERFGKKEGSAIKG